MLITFRKKEIKMKHYKIVLLSMFAALLTGCAAPHYDGPGSFQDFANARYQCLRETQQRMSGATINQYGGSATSQVIPSCSAFNSCLATKGYYQSQNGKFNPNSIAIRCN